jgi:hypothetical protein
MCELRCPDFAIEVHPAEENVTAARSVNHIDLSLPPEAHHA